MSYRCDALFDMRDAVSCRAHSRRLKADLAAIEHGFLAYLIEKQHAAFTIQHYSRFLIRVAEFASRRGKSIFDLDGGDVMWVLRGCLPRWKPESRRSRRAALHSWLKFSGRFKPKSPATPGQRFLHDYSEFMQFHRGLATCTRERYLRVARHYLAWQVRRTETKWRQVSPEHIWAFAEQLIRDHKPKTICDELSALRRFLFFMHLRGVFALCLPSAVPRVANYGQVVRKQTLTEAERRRFLASFERRTPEGCRDYTMAICMLDLGLRAIEICRLRLSDIDWAKRQMTVPPAKAGLGRQLPIPAQVLEALRVYVRARPASPHDELFVGHTLLIGRPLSSCAVGSAMTRAYRRCGFPRSWHGSHRLRHTFATRLCAHGADLKQIADLLGHRLVSTTNRYAQIDSRGLRALAQPWRS